jgi:hypothetical protein
MKMRVQLIIEDATGITTATDVAVIERHAEDLIGLSLEEAKAMTGAETCYSVLNIRCQIGSTRSRLHLCLVAFC